MLVINATFDINSQNWMCLTDDYLLHAKYQISLEWRRRLPIEIIGLTLIRESITTEKNI